MIGIYEDFWKERFASLLEIAMEYEVPQSRFSRISVRLLETLANEEITGSVECYARKYRRRRYLVHCSEAINHFDGIAHIMCRLRCAHRDISF